MGWWVRSCLQSVLKLVNSMIGFTGMGMILYALWMLRSWYKHMDGTSFGGSAQYMVFVFLLITLEAAITAFIFLNRDWEEALSIFTAMVLRALGPDSGTDCDSDDDSIPARLPLLRNQVNR
ncbi:Stem-specific protein [Musa troglodytarum]|uniref:Stem-specific protein n=1 Tax=Musa troglodytarum TaxID=320322 RepID=A0A9E7L3E8_9LILI|nr:Stem-specific protein [Musa troglodytarum]